METKAKSPMLKLFPPPHLAEQASRLAAQTPSLSGCLFATSGTTGDPKWILHSQAGLDWCARTVNTLFDCQARDVWGLALPEFHVGGYCLTHRARLAGGSLRRFPHRWQATAFSQWLAAEEVTVTSLVPTQVFDLVQAYQRCPPLLRVALIGGEELPANTFEQAIALGWPLITSYGMTETAGLIAASALGTRELHPLPGWELGMTAENLLTVDGPGLFSGQVTSAGLQATPHPFVTKDIVALSQDTLTVRGRSDDQVKILGELVDLHSLRQSLAAALPDLRSTVLAFPENRRGHQLIAVLESDPEPSLCERVSTWNTTLPAFARCLKPVFLTPWPRTPLGKTDQQALRAQVTENQNSPLPDN